MRKEKEEEEEARKGLRGLSESLILISGFEECEGERRRRRRDTEEMEGGRQDDYVVRSDSDWERTCVHGVKHAHTHKDRQTERDRERKKDERTTKERGPARMRMLAEFTCGQRRERARTEKERMVEMWMKICRERERMKER
jgi:hypothetical protein